MTRSFLLFSLILSLSAGAAARQGPVSDSARIVILSDSVGPVISAAAHERFRIFSQFQNFSEAVVVQLPDTTYAVRITLGSGDVRHDTLLRYSSSTLQMMAEKIDHFEELSSGTYVIGSSPPLLRLAQGSVIVPRGSLPPPPPGGSKTAVPLPAAGSRQPDTLTLVRPVRPEIYAAGPLPLARAAGMSMPRSYPSLAFAMGFRTFSPDFSGLGAALGGAPRLDISPMIDISPEVLFTDEIAIQADAGASTGEQCFTGGISAVIYFHPFEDRRWRPFLEAGYVWTSMASDVGGPGGGGIAFTAGGGGVRFGAGMEFLLGASAALSVDVCYAAIGSKSSVFTDWQAAEVKAVPVSVDLSSIQYSIRIKFQ